VQTIVDDILGPSATQSAKDFVTLLIFLLFFM